MTALLDFTQDQASRFGAQPLVAHHRLHESGLALSDDDLIALLDAYPRNNLQAFTMGQDYRRREDWKYVDASEASGKEIFAATLRGRLWLNLLRVDQADRAYGDLIHRLSGELKARCPGMGLDKINFATLLISSPRAIVYYHFDASHQSLWHLRGRKRIWLYPAGDERFVSPDVMEAIFAGTYEYDEEIPYSTDFDAHAAVFDLVPGDVATWPQNAPHRIVNEDSLNVSLSTGFDTEAANRRYVLYSANRFFRSRFGLPFRSTRETGVGAMAKSLAYRVCRRAGAVAPAPARRPYPRTRCVDANAEFGWRERD